jgi:hypothetical protein
LDSNNYLNAIGIMQERNHYFRKLRQAVLELSVNQKEWAVAAKEWIADRVEAEGPVSTCLCTHWIYENCLIYNRRNGKRGVVGNCCIRHFSGENDDLISDVSDLWGEKREQKRLQAVAEGKADSCMRMCQFCNKRFKVKKETLDCLVCKQCCKEAQRINETTTVAAAPKKDFSDESDSSSSRSQQLVNEDDDEEDEYEYEIKNLNDSSRQLIDDDSDDDSEDEDEDAFLLALTQSHKSVKESSPPRQLIDIDDDNDEQEEREKVKVQVDGICIDCKDAFEMRAPWMKRCFSCYKNYKPIVAVGDRDVHCQRSGCPVSFRVHRNESWKKLCPRCYATR